MKTPQDQDVESFPDHYVVAGFSGNGTLEDLRHGAGSVVVTV